MDGVSRRLHVVVTARATETTTTTSAARCGFEGDALRRRNKGWCVCVGGYSSTYNDCGHGGDGNTALVVCLLVCVGRDDRCTDKNKNGRTGQACYWHIIHNTSQAASSSWVSTPSIAHCERGRQLASLGHGSSMTGPVYGSRSTFLRAGSRMRSSAA